MVDLVTLLENIHEKHWKGSLLLLRKTVYCKQSESAIINALLHSCCTGGKLQICTWDLLHINNVSNNLATYHNNHCDHCHILLPF